MKITDLPAYQRIKAKFENGEFQTGTVSHLPIYSYEHGRTHQMTPGHYVDAINYSKIAFEDIPEEFLTRDFFIHALVDTKKDIIAYVKARMGNEFDRTFFKDYITSNSWSLEFKQNCFEYMPLDYIDEEMVSCAILKAVDARYVDRRGDFEDWFYSVARRKPDVLTQDFYTLGARLWAEKLHGKNRFLDITPKQYQTLEYYFAMCLENDSPVMEDFPEEIITTEFLVALINDNVQNIRSFSDKALHRTVPVTGPNEKMLCWQIAILIDGYTIKYLPLNEEVVTFFLNHYDKDSSEYEYGFKENYKKWLKKNQGSSSSQSKVSNELKRAIDLTLGFSFLGIGVDNATDIANKDLQAGISRSTLLPIKYDRPVPREFCKKYDREEYLAEIYKKLGIEVLSEHDNYFYEVNLPSTLKVEADICGNHYCVKDFNDNILIKYRDVGPFWDRSVDVFEINVSL